MGPIGVPERRRSTRFVGPVRATGRTRRSPLVALALLFWAAIPPGPSFAADEAPEVDAALAAVAAGGAVIVMRHALAPGTGDPADFERGDCATQRNLSEAGREQARRIGRRLRAALGTDEVDVTALTGVFPSSGEPVVFGRAPDDPSGAPGVLARLAIPAP